MLLLLFIAGVAATDPERTAYPPLLLRLAEPGAQADPPAVDTVAVIGPVTITPVDTTAEIGALNRTLAVPAADYTANPT
jgi:hypothetical protein